MTISRRIVMSILLCYHCRAAVPEALFNTAEPVPCPRCQSALLVRVFPALFRPPVTGRAAEALGSGEDASCYYHPRKKAVVPCGTCGRFLCALCDLEIEGRHVCPACATGTAAAAGELGLTRPRVLHDSAALRIVVLPIIFPLLAPLTLLTAPLALYLVWRYWHEPAEHPLGRTRWRLVLAALGAVATLLGWAWIGFVLLRSRF